MRKPLVSVLIPAYNHENYVQATIKSIIAQTYDNIELIIIDDGSKDTTWQKINTLKTECKKRFQHIYFSAKPNSGTCKTLNMLLEEAKGNYIYLIASDDLAEPEALQKQVDFLQKHPDFVLVVGDNRFIDSHNHPCGWDDAGNIQYGADIKYATFASFLQEKSKIDFSTSSFGSYEQLYRGNHIPNGYLFRRDAIGNTPFTPLAPLEDYWLMLQLAKRGKMKFLNEILFSYRQHAGNTVKNKEKMHQMDLKTRQYEQNLLEELNRKGQLSKELQQILTDGVLIGSKQFLGFHLLKYRQYQKYMTRLTFMGHVIYSRTKNF